MFTVDVLGSAVASEQAMRRSPGASVQFVHGDCLTVTDELPTAAVVTLDRVICCYPSYEPFWREALRHAENGFAFSYPRDRWYVS